MKGKAPNEVKKKKKLAKKLLCQNKGKAHRHTQAGRHVTRRHSGWAV